jgi:hypothetical protein
MAGVENVVDSTSQVRWTILSLGGAMIARVEYERILAYDEIVRLFELYDYTRALFERTGV